MWPPLERLEAAVNPDSWRRDASSQRCGGRGQRKLNGATFFAPAVSALDTQAMGLGTRSG